MTKYMPFYYDIKGFYQNDKSFMITGRHVAFLTAFLNSSLFKFCFIDNFPELLGGTRAREGYLISSQARYDHFDTPPYGVL